MNSLVLEALRARIEEWGWEPREGETVTVDVCHGDEGAGWRTRHEVWIGEEEVRLLSNPLVLDD